MSTAFGQVLADGDGYTLYASSEVNTPEASACTTCGSWSPALAETVEVGPGVDPALTSLVPLADGSKQATYNGRPLYRFAGDVRPAMTEGQGTGGTWGVVNAKGAMVST